MIFAGIILQNGNPLRGMIWVVPPSTVKWTLRLYDWDDDAERQRTPLTFPEPFVEIRVI